MTRSRPERGRAEDRVTTVYRAWCLIVLFTTFLGQAYVYFECFFALSGDCSAFLGRLCRKGNEAIILIVLFNALVGHGVGALAWGLLSASGFKELCDPRLLFIWCRSSTNCWQFPSFVAHLPLILDFKPLSTVTSCCIPVLSKAQWSSDTRPNAVTDQHHYAILLFLTLILPSNFSNPLFPYWSCLYLFRHPDSSCQPTVVEEFITVFPGNHNQRDEISKPVYVTLVHFFEMNLFSLSTAQSTTPLLCSADITEIPILTVLHQIQAVNQA